MGEEKEGYIRVKKAYLILGGIAAASFLSGWLASYLIQAPLVTHSANATGYQLGYATGYTNGIKDIYQFNSQPAFWKVLDQKQGVARMNDTQVLFVFQESNNQTLVLNLKSDTPLGQKAEMGTLFQMTSPVNWPQSIAQKFDVTNKEYYVFQNLEGQRYLLELQ